MAVPNQTETPAAADAGCACGAGPDLDPGGAGDYAAVVVDGVGTASPSTGAVARAGIVAGGNIAGHC